MTTGADDGGAEVVGPGAFGAGIGHMPASWDLEADVVVIGAGATGLPAAIKAIDEGASVIVVEANYDVGGHAILSGGNVPLGGGMSAQSTYGIEDSLDIVFADLTDWPIVQPNGWPDYRYKGSRRLLLSREHAAGARRRDQQSLSGQTDGRRHPASDGGEIQRFCGLQCGCGFRQAHA
jgi:glycine/D-amino acid oxidase-like deaminating enzyme